MKKHIIHILSITAISIATASCQDDPEVFPIDDVNTRNNYTDPDTIPGSGIKFTLDSDMEDEIEEITYNF